MITFNTIDEHRNNMVKTDGTFSGLDRYKLMKMISTYIEEKQYAEEDLRKVQHMFYLYCLNGVKSEIINKIKKEDTYNENNITFKDNVESVEYLEIYKKLLILDKKRKTVLWSERSLFALNFFEPSRKFLQENNYNTEKLEELSWKYLYKQTSLEHALSEKSKETITNIKDLCPHYLKKIDWSKISMNSHLLVLLAIEYGYDLNQKQINEYFPLIKPSADSQINKRMDLFIKVLTHSSFFKSNVTKWKDLKDGLGKNFNISMKGLKEYNEKMTVDQKFIFLLAESPILRHDNMKKKLEKKEKTTLFGKPYLNKEEEQEYIKMLEQRSMQTKVKKTKI